MKKLVNSTLKVKAFRIWHVGLSYLRSVCIRSLNAGIIESDDNYICDAS
jgi:hypothetical protein